MCEKKMDFRDFEEWFSNWIFSTFYTLSWLFVEVVETKNKLLLSMREKTNKINGADFFIGLSLLSSNFWSLCTRNRIKIVNQFQHKKEDFSKVFEKFHESKTMMKLS